ncbi:MAG: efflux RND transporter permease subunit [Phycisphaerae bacterium]|nr:efflux RND transporter permease subunit [Phycisphaerae bacterium]
MFLSDASVRRPVALSCLIIGLTLLGFNAYRKMGLELMPRTDLPFITVVTIYPGASPEQIETDIAKRIEDQMVTIDGLKHVSSSCMENVCQTLLEFNLGVNVDIAATDVREKLDLIRADFPVDAEDPKIMKFDINAMPIITLALTGNASLEELYDYADNTLRDRITVISGVADVELVGGAEREVHVMLDRQKLAARGLSSMDVVQAVQQGIGTIPSGRVTEGSTEYSVKLDAEYENIEDIASLEVLNDNGRRCYVHDVGYVEMTTEELRQKASVDGRDCIAIKVVKKAEANAVQVVSNVRDAMTKLNRELPGGMELVWVDDDGRFIEATVESAWINVGQGIALTALVLFFFLYNLRATLIISITMPLTIVIGLFFMQFLEYTLNTSTLIAIGMSVGILVTNSIVVMEAIVKRVDLTGNVKESARVGASEIFDAILASAGTNVVVLFPIAMMGSLIGAFMRPLATTMIIMTAVSLFISFTLTPMLCSILLKSRKANSSSLLAKMERAWNTMFDRIRDGYRGVLAFNEKHWLSAVLILFAVLVVFVHSLSLAKKVGFGFFADSDKGQIAVKLEYPTRYGLKQTQLRVRQVEERLKDLPELKHVLSTIGKVEGIIGQASEGVYLAQILLKFSERDERDLTIDTLETEVRKRMAEYPECIVTVSLPKIIGGQASDIEFEISGDELGALDQLALKSQELADKIDGFRDSDTTVRIGKPELLIRPRRAVLADLGVPAVGLGIALRANLEGLEAGVFKKGARNYDIVVEFIEEEGKDQVQEFLFPGAPGHPLLLSNLGDVEERLAPIQITRKDKRRISKLLANIESKKPLGTAVDELSAAVDEKAGLPPGYEYFFAGMTERMKEAQAEFGEAGLVAIVLVILTLAAILESFKQPWLILVTLPLALIGVFWALAIGGESISMFVLMSIVMMIGIVVNNAILIMDQFNIHVKEGIPRHKAMVAAASERFRPIVMITIAAVLGMLPLALGQGIGAEMRNGVGIAAVGGIAVSGVLTLVVMPILYDLFTRKDRRE